MGKEGQAGKHGPASHGRVCSKHGKRVKRRGDGKTYYCTSEGGHVITAEATQILG